MPVPTEKAAGARFEFEFEQLDVPMAQDLEGGHCSGCTGCGGCANL